MVVESLIMTTEYELPAEWQYYEPPPPVSHVYPCCVPMCTRFHNGLSQLTDCIGHYATSMFWNNISLSNLLLKSVLIRSTLETKIALARYMLEKNPHNVVVIVVQNSGECDTLVETCTDFSYANLFIAQDTGKQDGTKLMIETNNKTLREFPAKVRLDLEQKMPVIWIMFNNWIYMSPFVMFSIDEMERFGGVIGATYHYVSKQQPQQQPQQPYIVTPKKAVRPNKGKKPK